MKYEFTDAPDYNKLKFLLEMALIDQGMTPKKDFNFWKMERKRSLIDQKIYV